MGEVGQPGPRRYVVKDLILEEGPLKAIEIEGKFPGGKAYRKRCLELS